MHPHDHQPSCKAHHNIPSSNEEMFHDDALTPLQIMLHHLRDRFDAIIDHHSRAALSIPHLEAKNFMTRSDFLIVRFESYPLMMCLSDLISTEEILNHTQSSITAIDHER